MRRRIVINTLDVSTPVLITTPTPDDISNIDTGTSDKVYQYNFSANVSNVNWLATPSEYAAINSSGDLTLTFAKNVNASGTINVITSLSPYGSSYVSWNYNAKASQIGVDYLYDAYTTSSKTATSVVYSLRKVRADYIGPVVKIRRSVDNLEDDFFSSASGILTNIDGIVLQTWIDIGTGFVSIWYDQSENGRNATQATAAYQPQINFTLFPYPTIFFNSAFSGDRKYLTIESLTLTAPYTFVFASRKIRQGRWIAPTLSTPNTVVGYYGASEATFYVDNNPGSGTGDSVTLSKYAVNYNTDHIHMFAKESSQLSYYYMNGYLKHMNIPNTATSFGANIMIGGGYNTNEFGGGYMMEMSIHNTNLPASELNSIQTSMSTFYSIPSASIPTYLSWPTMATATQVGTSTTWQVTYNGQVYEVSAYSQLNNTTESIMKAFDKNGTTFYTTNNLGSAVGSQSATLQYIRFKFPAAVNSQILQIGSVNVVNRAINAFRFQASVDDSTWVTLYTISSQEAWTIYESREFYVYSSTSYQYYRLQIDSFFTTSGANEYVSLRDVNLLHTSSAIIAIPYSISGLQLYLDASNAGQGKTIWVDRSPNNYNFTNNSGALRYDGGIAHMNFEGSYGAAKRLVTSALTNIPSFTTSTFIMFSTILNSTTAQRTLLRGSGTTADYSIAIQTGTNILGMFDAGTNAFISAGFDVSTIPNYTSRFNMLVWKFSTTSPYYQFKYNSSSTWYTITNANAIINSGFACIGANPNNTTGTATANSLQYWGKVALALYYNSHLSDGTIAEIYNFYKQRFGLYLTITSSQPSTIYQNTLSSPYTISYTFTAYADTIDGDVTWSITPATFGSINATTGELTLTFPQGTTANGMFVVTAQNLKAKANQTWLYTAFSYNAASYPITPWAILDAIDISQSDNTNVAQWGGVRKFKQVTTINQPIYYVSGGFNNRPYVFFNRNNSTFLNAEVQTLNMSTNGGFTAMFLLKFTGSAGTYERLIDFSNGPDNNNVMFHRMSTLQTIRLFMFAPTTGTALTSTNATTTSNDAIQDEWMILACRYIKLSKMQVYKNNRLLVESAQTTTDHADRTLGYTYIGRSPYGGDAYLNAHVSQMALYDRALSDAEMTSLYRKMANVTNVTFTTSNPKIINQSTLTLSTVTYAFSAISNNTLTWSNTPTTYGSINSLVGTLTQTFPIGTRGVGTFIVTGTDSGGSATQSWNYTYYDFATPVYPTTPLLLESGQETVKEGSYGLGTYIITSSSGTPNAIFDGLDYTTWSSSTFSGFGYNGGSHTRLGAGTYNGPWIMIQLPYAIRLMSMDVAPYNSTVYPQNMYLLASNDGINWVELVSFGGSIVWAGSSVKVNFQVFNGTTGMPNPYNRYILTWTSIASSGGYIARLNEWRLSEFVVFNPSLTITSSQPTNILKNTINIPYSISYVFTATSNNTPITWSITPTTYGNINSSTGELTLIFPIGTIDAGSFIVTATDSASYTKTHSWKYNITTTYPSSPWALLDASDISQVNNTNIATWGNDRSFVQTTNANQPTYISSNGYNNAPYIKFDRRNSAFLDAGNQTLNISAGGGFTTMCLIRFTGAGGATGLWERIFDFLGNSSTSSLLLYRNSYTQNLQFSIVNPTTNNATTVNSPIIQDTWIVVAGRYIKQSRFQLYVNNLLWSNNITANDLSDRTVVNSFIGKSVASSDAYLNASISKLFMYDRALSDTEMTNLYNYMIGIRLPIIQTLPQTITGGTLTSPFVVLYAFVGAASAGTISWSLEPKTYGDINASTGALTLTFPTGTTASGTFTVSATDANGSSTKSWKYIIVNAISPLFTFSTFLFTNLYYSNNTAPTFAEFKTAYVDEEWANSYLNSYLTWNGYQMWTVPESTNYTLVARGANGSRCYSRSGVGGLGGIVTAVFSLIRGDQLLMIVGNKGGSSDAGLNAGGGGSFIILLRNGTYTPLMVGGGGGGSNKYTDGGSSTLVPPGSATTTKTSPWGGQGYNQVFVSPGIIGSASTFLGGFGGGGAGASSNAGGGGGYEGGVGSSGVGSGGTSYIATNHASYVSSSPFERQPYVIGYNSASSNFVQIALDPAGSITITKM